MMYEGNTSDYTEFKDLGYEDILNSRCLINPEACTLEPSFYELSEINTVPLVPENPTYPGIQPVDYPPKQILEGYKELNEGLPVLYLKWTSTRKPLRNIAAFQLCLCERSQEPYNPSYWSPFDPVYCALPMAVNIIPKRKLNRRYYFTVRVADDLDRWGPFSDPVSFYL